MKPMSQELGLGQRTGKEILNSEWHPDEVKLVEDAGLTLDEVIRQWVVVQNDNTLNTAIGGARAWKEGRGQERNEKFAEVPQAPEHFTPTPPADAKSTPVTELDPSDPQYVAPPSV